jgi:hypothetical protein
MQPVTSGPWYIYGFFVIAGFIVTLGCWLRSSSSFRAAGLRKSRWALSGLLMNVILLGPFFAAAYLLYARPKIREATGGHQPGPDPLEGGSSPAPAPPGLRPPPPGQVWIICTMCRGYKRVTCDHCRGRWEIYSKDHCCTGGTEVCGRCRGDGYILADARYNRSAV